MVMGGCTLEAAFKVAFSATVETVNSNGTTIITAAAFLPYIAIGNTAVYHRWFINQRDRAGAAD